MYEHLATLWGGPPNPSHLNLYKKWAEGGWGMIITGNVQVDGRHMSLGRDMCIATGSGDAAEESMIASYTHLAEAIHSRRHKCKDKVFQSLAILQLNHTGRQSSRFLGGRWFWQHPDGPNITRVGARSKEGWLGKAMYKFLFQSPKPLTASKAAIITKQFGKASVIARRAGFDGVQVHASHGCEYFEPCFIL
jgi:2,4-dienoyl-CoA reductase-like NADH-dependent reductase (Old Yellow Enzyme family)